MIIKGNQFYKISEEYNATYCITNENGLLEIANNDRTKEDGTEEEEFTTVEDAIKFLEQEKLLTVKEIDTTEIQVEKNYIVVEY